jgi:hypothetical protein
MADEESDAIEDALNPVVITLEKSPKMKKELKQTILETVSTLRNLFVKIITNSETKDTKIRKLEDEVTKANADRHRAMGNSGKNSPTPSLIQGRVLDAPRETSVILSQKTNGYTETEALPGSQRQVTPQMSVSDRSPALVTKGRLYSEALTSRIAPNKFKLTVKPKEPTPPESIKGLLKAKINPTNIRVGINTLRTQRNGQVLIETSSREELQAIEKDIKEKCGDKLEVSVHKLRSPRLVILNIPEEISVDNVVDTIAAQNTDINLQQGEIQPKFSYQTKKHGRNLVIEVEAGTRRRLLQSRMKLGWEICTVRDYIVATRCFKCSKYNHRAHECRGEECCPLCAGNHKMKDCTANAQDYKCINCTSFNKHNQGKTVCANHSSLDKNCPSFLAVLEKHKNNTNY